MRHTNGPIENGLRSMDISGWPEPRSKLTSRQATATTSRHARLFVADRAILARNVSGHRHWPRPSLLARWGGSPTGAILAVHIKHEPEIGPPSRRFFFWSWLVVQRPIFGAPCENRKSCYTIGQTDWLMMGDCVARPNPGLAVAARCPPRGDWCFSTRRAAAQ